MLVTVVKCLALLAGAFVLDICVMKIYFKIINRRKR